MPVNKVEYFGNTLLDLTGDNVTPGDVKKGVVFHDATGAQQIGEGAGLDVNEQTNPSGGKTVYINSEAPEESVLPEGYTRLKYIQSDGRQYVNTGVYPDQDTKISLKVSCENGDFYCRVGQSTGSQRFGLYAVRDTSRIDFLFGGVGYVTGAISGLSFPAEISLENGLLTANQKTYEFAPQGAFTAPRTLPLFAEDVNGSIAKGKGRLYEGQIYGSGTIVRNYIPCLNASGEAGLWDTVTQAFFGDAAGVGFIAGPVVLEYTLPEGFEELTWIQSDGRQYVNTQFKPNQDTRVVIDCKLDTYVTNGSFIFGVRSPGTTRGFAAALVTGPNRSYYNYGSQLDYANIPDIYSRMVIEANGASAEFLAGADKATITHAPAAFTAEYPLAIGVLIEGGSVYDRTQWIGKIYSGQIYDDDTIVRNYIPCLNASGEAGLWDAVTQAFFGDAAGVGFIAGPKVSVSKVVLEDEVLIDLTGDTISPETVLAGFIGHDKTGAQFVGELVQKSGYQVAAGTITVTSANPLTISGLPFTPIGACVVSVFKSRTYAYNHGRITGADTTSNRYAVADLDGDGNARASYRNLTAVTKTSGSISITAGSAFYEEYQYVVWGE